MQGARRDAAAVKKTWRRFSRLEILILELGPAFANPGRPAIAINANRQ